MTLLNVISQGIVENNTTVFMQSVVPQLKKNNKTKQTNKNPTTLIAKETKASGIRGICNQTQ